MNRNIIVAFVTLFATGVAFAKTPSYCELKAIGKNGNPLAGADKSSFVKKCETEMATKACEANATDKDGKALAGTARNSSITKCMKKGVAAK